MEPVSANSTEAVLEQHIQAIISRDLNSIMRDYADDAVVFAPVGVFKGLQSIRAFFQAALETLTPEALEQLKFSKKEFHDEHAYVLWSAGQAVPFAGDVFQIRDGKILTQGIVQQVSP
jgi:ketosteroid isomerase-like protein